MAYKITVLKNEINKVKNYEVAQIAYKTEDGKTKGMKVLSFVQKDVFAVLQGVQAGDVLEANFEQNDKGFWQFKDLKKTGEKGDASVTAASAPAAAKSSGNWETSAERQARQVMIVRQSSLSTAVALLAATGIKKVETESVIEIAKDFEAYVLGGNTASDKPTGEVV